MKPHRKIKGEILYLSESWKSNKGPYYALVSCYCCRQVFRVDLSEEGYKKARQLMIDGKPLETNVVAYYEEAFGKGEKCTHMH